MKIAVVDYGMGNLMSVYNALRSLGADAKVVDTAGDIAKAEKIILPGVGAFGDTINGLEKKGLTQAIRDFIASGKVYLGICLGLQILFEESEEGGFKGLEILKGRVRRFKEKKGVKIPHMGWNQVKVKSQKSKVKSTSQKSKVMEGIRDGADFYFVHSYYAEPLEVGVIAATTEYAGVEFASFVAKDNIYATQFHPEKSQSVGLKFLQNFIEL